MNANFAVGIEATNVPALAYTFSFDRDGLYGFITDDIVYTVTPTYINEICH